ncbi:hypothetical protein Ahy_A07g035198 [Arachis hypogaea]|uniref:Uncharacterized protein n=1 Tax=Arachis hypogaea TaxID=3818 RepID=A0A445CDG4_ARAHY|nr:hypothetical protein Ahy_A07g035198 [Arachis hypogaea]
MDYSKEVAFGHYKVVVDLDYNRITTSEKIPPIPEPEYHFLRGEDDILKVLCNSFKWLSEFPNAACKGNMNSEEAAQISRRTSRLHLLHKILLHLYAKKCDHYYSLAKDFLEITPRKTIGELKECKEDGDYAVYGTIMGVIGGLDWFVAQYRCGSEVVLKLGSYYCEKSSKHIDLFSLKL